MRALRRPEQPVPGRETEVVRRVAEGHVEGLLAGGAEPPENVGPHDAGSVAEVQRRHVGPHDRGRSRVPLHERRVRRAPRQGFEAQGAAAGEGVEHHQTVEVYEAAERREEGLADAVGRGTHPVARRHLQAASPRLAGDDAGHRGAPGRRHMSVRVTRSSTVHTSPVERNPSRR